MQIQAFLQHVCRIAANATQQRARTGELPAGPRGSRFSIHRIVRRARQADVLVRIGNLARRVGLTNFSGSSNDVARVRTRNPTRECATRTGERLLAHAHEILRAHDEAVAELTGASLSGDASGSELPTL